MNKLMVIIIVMVFVMPSVLALTNKTIYYKIYPNQTMDLYDKINWSISFPVINDSTERSFDIPVEKDKMWYLNDSKGNIAIYCGDNSFVCPSLTIPAAPSCPEIPPCPAAPQCPAQNDEAEKACIAALDKKLNTTKETDYFEYVIFGGILIAIIVVLYLTFRPKPERQLVIKKYEEPTPTAKKPIQSEKSKPEQVYKPIFETHQIKEESKQAIEDLKQITQNNITADIQKQWRQFQNEKRK